LGPDGLEPSTPRLSSACSNQLSYEPGKAKTDGLGDDRSACRHPGGACDAVFFAALSAPKNGAGRIRTGDPLLAKQVLCQLSYDPETVGNLFIKND
jgi:hypothetical protein